MEGFENQQQCCSCSYNLLLGITYFYLFIYFIFFWGGGGFPDFHGFWRSVMSICLSTEVKRQWATLVLGWVNALLHYSCL